MAIKSETLTVSLVSYRDIEQLVYDNFGIGNTGNKYHHAYEFAVIEQCGNDSFHLFSNVTREIDDADYYEKDIARFVKDGTPGDLTNYQILGILCQHAFIPPGDYLVSVCW